MEVDEFGRAAALLRGRDGVEVWAGKGERVWEKEEEEEGMLCQPACGILNDDAVSARVRLAWCDLGVHLPPTQA